MRLRMSQAEAARARDCFVLSAKIMDVRCDVLQAGRIWRRDPNAAKAFLKGAMEKSVEIAGAFPDKAAAARSVRDEAKAAAASIPAKPPARPGRGKDVEVARRIESAIVSLDEVYHAAKARCGVP